MPRALALLLVCAACAGDARVVDTRDNPLAGLVRWRTEVPGTSAVRFGHGGRTWELRDDTITDRHEVLLFGLRPETDYDLELRSVTRGGRERVQVLPWTSGRAPPLAVRYEVSVHDPDQAEAGWTLVNLMGPEDDGLVAMYDLEGYPVWAREIRGKRAVLDASWTDRGTVLIGGSLPTGERPIEVGLDGAPIWEGRKQVRERRSGRQHHHHERLANGHILSLENEVRDGVLGDVVYEETAGGRRVWEWSGFDHFEPLDRWDWTHANWAHTDGTFGWVSLAAVGKIVKFRIDSGEVVWVLGRGGTLALRGDDRWFRFQHAPTVLPDEHILVYDNQGAGGRTRLVEYAVDEGAGTATLVWSYDGGEDNRWYARRMGSATPLPWGTVLVSAGDDHDDERVFEITRDGELVWRMHPRKVYRARRVPSPLDPFLLDPDRADPG